MRFLYDTKMLPIIIFSFTEQNQEKPPSARTITIKSASKAEPNSTTPAGTKEETATGDEFTATEEEPIDLTEPGLENAATKIQAAFRGHHTRRAMKQEEKSAKPKSAQQQQQEEFENDFSSGDVGKRGYFIN